MKNIDTFREQVRAALSHERGAQAALVKATGVPQYAVSRFLSGKDLPGRYLLPIQDYLNENSSLLADTSKSVSGIPPGARP